MRREMVGAAALGASLVPALAGIAASAALAVDYLRPRPVFCPMGGGCEAVRHTVFASLFGVPTPILGLAAFVAIGVTALLNGRRARLASLILSVGAGLVGLFLLGVQARMGAICPYCCVADASGIASALVATARFWMGTDAAPPRVLSYAGAGSLALAALVPLAAGFRANPVPPIIRQEMARTPKGDVTIVDFVDFECPFCRMTHSELQPIVDAHRDRIRLLRLQVPLRMHPHALDAARAACCGDRLGKGEAMADALFVAPVDQLTPDGCEKIAEALGLPRDRYRDCIADPATSARIEEDRTAFKAAGGYALPTIWIDGRELVGAQSRDVLAQTLHEALAHAAGS
jgi:uncharacterized membrane protein/predicted DsbA family dithiol-disulfide isomerase